MEKKITRSNYETFLIDYLDGILSPEECDEVIAFLSENPDIAEEFENISSFQLTPENIGYQNKENLKITTERLIPDRFQNLDEFLIAQLENELTPEELTLADKLLKVSDEASDEYRILQKTKLIPDLNLRFRQKDKLKRGVIPIFTQRQIKYAVSFSIAAMLAITFIFVNRNLYKHEQSPVVAQKQIRNTIRENTTENQHPFIAEQPEMKQGKTIYFRNHPNKEINDLDIQKENFTVSTFQVDKAVPEIIDSVPGLADRNCILRFDYNEEGESQIPVYTVDQYLLRQFRKRLLKETKEQYESRKFSVWDIADLGIRKTGSLFGKDWHLIKEYNEEGKIQNLAFQSRFISINYPVSGNEK